MKRSSEKNGAQNWIDLLEHTYSLEGDNAEWLRGILSCISPDSWKDWTAAYSFDLTPSNIMVKDVAVRGAPDLQNKIQELLRNSSPESMDLVFRHGKVVGTLSEYLWTHHSEHEPLFRRVTQGPPDVLGVVAHSGDGQGVVLNLPLKSRRCSTIAERRGWMRGAAHIGAALRLRRLLPQLKAFDGNPIEAIFDNNGRLHEAREDAINKTAQERLRDAVKHIDRIRSAAGRQNQDAGLQAWEALVHGRWSLVDKFDTDQRRFIVAVRNHPHFPDPRGLSQQERQVAEYLGLGRSLKEISYILGIPSASAENSARRAKAKLGLNSRVELAAFFSPQGLRARLAEAMLERDTLLIGSSTIWKNCEGGKLTSAEQSVLALIISGSSNIDISQRRATSARTVANQVQSIFRKFGARSRGELISRIAGP